MGQFSNPVARHTRTNEAEAGSFSCVSIWYLTIFHGSFLKLCDPQQPTKTTRKSGLIMICDNAFIFETSDMSFFRVFTLEIEQESDWSQHLTYVCCAKARRRKGESVGFGSA